MLENHKSKLDFALRGNEVMIKHKDNNKALYVCYVSRRENMKDKHRYCQGEAVTDTNVEDEILDIWA